MAYLFQHGPAILSGAVDQEGSIDIKDDGSGEFELKHDGNTIISSTRALANVTTISGSEVISGRDLKLDVGGKVGISTDTDLLTLTAGNVSVAGAMSASARIDGAGLRIDTGGVIGTAGDNDLLTLNNGSLVVAGAGSFTGGNVAATAGAVSGSTGLAGRGLTIDSDGVIGTSTDADLMQLGDNKLKIVGDLSASADLEGANLVIGGYGTIGVHFDTDLMRLMNQAVHVSGALSASADLQASGLRVDTDGVIGTFSDTDLLTLADAELKVAGAVSGSGNLKMGGTVQLDGVVDTAMVIGDDLYFRDSDGLMKREAASDVRDLYFSAVSGDATVAAGGALTIANDAVEQAMIADDAVGADQLAANAVVNASIASNAAIDMDKLDGGSLASALTDLAQGDLLYAGDVDDSSNLKSITFSNFEDAIFGNVSGDATIAAGGALTIANDAVEQAMIADDAVGADQLAANAVVNASIASNAAIDMDKLDGGSLAASLTDLDQADLLYAGDNSDSSNLKSITFSNLEDAIFGNVSGDVLVAAGGAATIQADAVESGMLNDNIISGQDDIGADFQVTDEILVSDGGTLKRADLSRFATMLAGAGLSADSGVLSTQAGAVRVISDASTLAEGYNFYTGSAAKSVSLPASPTVGDVVVVKAGNLGSGNGLTVARQGSHTIDGLTEVKLESDYAAASFVYLEDNNWGII